MLASRSSFPSLAVLATLSGALASGCGFGLTPGAVDCGVSPTGIHVYVDGVSVAEKVTHDANGNSTTSIAETAMTCETALVEVQQAHDLAVQLGVFPASQGFSYRVEFINTTQLSNETPAPANNDGYTVGDAFAHDSAIGYGQDTMEYYTLNTSDPLYSQGAQPSVLTLLHEMKHMAYGQSDHCNWSESFAPKLKPLGWAAVVGSSFVDSCSGFTCNGYKCQD